MIFDSLTTCVSQPDDSQVVLLGYDEGRQQRQSAHVLALVQEGLAHIQVQVTDLIRTLLHQR